ncbi:MAG: sigma factor, partial [Ilumatobacteraceae bacterium]
MERPASHIEVEVGERLPGADAGFGEMVGAELPRLQRIARLLVGAGDVADDLVAEAIARTLPKWRSGVVADPPAYLRRVLVNLAKRRWRRRYLALRHDRSALDWLQPASDH